MTQNMGLAPTIQLEEREYGLRLLLNTKFMEKEGFMRINIEIQDSEFDTNKDHDVQLGADIFVPSFVSKNVQTDVVVKSGEVIALGGRLHSEDVETKEKVPFLGDIPLLGELFTHTVSANKQNDLLFFLVPEIVDANEDTNDTHFYKEFKETSKTFHKDMQTLKADVNTQDQTQQMVIELEDESQNSAHVEPITQVQKPLEDLDFAKEKTEPKNDSLSAYKINVGKVFLRDAPVDGKRSFVWIKGHEFRATEDVSGKWLQIQEDCLQGCKAVEKELWIAKVYADKV
jgi:Flp pilus assembly secretin CpaC